MDDQEIIALYWQRNPDAIQQTAHKYGSFSISIARNILGNSEDAEECVNDAYLNLWNSIPPQRPSSLSAYLRKITRNLSFDRYRYNQAGKRGGSQVAPVLDELMDCVSDANGVEQEIDRQELLQAINDFLRTLPASKRNLFLCRYWYAFPISEIARKFGLREQNVSVALNRIRKKLKVYLSERGYIL